MKNDRSADNGEIQGAVDQSFLFTVDVEDWFQVENFKSSIPFASWCGREVRVENNIHGLLNLLDESEGNRVATFFVLGWIAERYPHLIKEIHARGHEIASHGYDHHLPTAQTKEDFRSDLIRSRKLLEDQIGASVCGYRAPSFAVNAGILKIVQESGYRYDSSYNSFDRHGRYGQVDMSGYPRKGVAIELDDDFFELPVSNLHLAGQVVPWGGGGYFRMIPARVYEKGIKYHLNKTGAFVFYMHPWELDPGQPRVKEASFPFKFRHYLNLHKGEDKVRTTLRELKSTPCVSCLSYLKAVI